jgi:hypothetical protein
MVVMAATMVMVVTMIMVVVVVVIMVVVMAVMMAMVVVPGAACTVQRLAEICVDLGHDFHRLGDMTGQLVLSLVGHDLSPFFKLFHMTLVVVNPVLQQNPQLLYIIHFRST